MVLTGKNTAGTIYPRASSFLPSPVPMGSK